MDIMNSSKQIVFIGFLVLWKDLQKVNIIKRTKVDKTGYIYQVIFFTMKLEL